MSLYTSFTRVLESYIIPIAGESVTNGISLQYVTALSQPCHF